MWYYISIIRVKKHRSSAVDRQNVPENFDAEILKKIIKQYS